MYQDRSIIVHKQSVNIPHTHNMISKGKKKKKKKKRHLEPQITIFVHINECSFPICCGKGNQTMRWLALCAARRYSAEFPSGRIRQRETFHSGLRPLGVTGVRGKRPVTAGKDRTLKYVPKNTLQRTSNHKGKMERYTLHGLYQNGKALQRLTSVGGLLQRGNLSPIRMKFPRHKSEGNKALQLIFDQKLSDKSIEEEEAEEEEEKQNVQIIKMNNQEKVSSHNRPTTAEERRLNRRRRRYSNKGQQDNVEQGRNKLNQLSQSVTYGTRPHTSEGSTRINRLNRTVPNNTRLNQYGMKKNRVPNRPSTAEGTMGHPSTRNNQYSKEWNESLQKKLLTEPEDLFESVYFTSYDHINQTLKTGDHVWVKVDVHGGAYVHTVASLGTYRAPNGLQKSNVDVRAMDDVPFVLDAFVKGRFVESYNKKKEQEEMQSEEENNTVKKKVKKVVKKKRIVFGLRRGGNIQETVKALLDNDMERSKIGNVIKDPNTVGKLRVLLAKNYLRLENLFRHFAFMLPGNSFTMGSSEFLMMCKACNVTTKKCDQSTQGRLFIAANVTKRTGKDGKQEMIKVEDDGGKNECVMYEFLEAVVRLGLVRYKGEFDNDPYEQMNYFIHTNLGPVADKIMKEWEEPLQHLMTDDIQNLLLSNGNIQMLQIAFFAFAKYKRRDGPKRSDSAQRAIKPVHRGLKAQLSMEDWMQFMQCTNFIDENITIQKGQESFIAAQMHSRIHSKVNKKALAADAGGFTLMDFGEFLEAFAQIAHRKFVGHDLKFHEKFEKLIHLTSAYIEHYKKSKWIKETKEMVKKVDFGLDEDEVIVDKTTDIHDNHGDDGLGQARTMGALDDIDATMNVLGLT